MDLKEVLESSGVADALEAKEREQCEMEAEILGFQIGLLSALRERGILSEEDCKAVSQHAQRAKELLLSTLDAALDFEEAVAEKDQDRAIAAGAKMKSLTLELTGMSPTVDEEDGRTIMAELDQVLDQIKKEAAE